MSCPPPLLSAAACGELASAADTRVCTLEEVSSLQQLLNVKTFLFNCDLYLLWQRYNKITITRSQQPDFTSKMYQDILGERFHNSLIKKSVQADHSCTQALRIVLNWRYSSHVAMFLGSTENMIPRWTIFTCGFRPEFPRRKFSVTNLALSPFRAATGVSNIIECLVYC